jgi:hypothetical protein
VHRLDGDDAEVLVDWCVEKELGIPEEGFLECGRYGEEEEDVDGVGY